MGDSDLRAMQDRKVRSLARYVYDYVPYYRSVFKASNLSPEDFHRADDIRLFPPLSRDTISSNYPAGIVVRGASVGNVLRTSGTTGKPLEVRWGSRFCDVHQALNLRRAFVQGMKPWERVAEVYTDSARDSGGTPSNTPVSGGRISKVLVGSFNVRYPTADVKHYYVSKKNIRSVARSLVEYQPHILYARPSHSRRLGTLMREWGKNISPRIIICHGEFVSQATKKDLADMFGAKVLVHYGAVEMGGMAFGCLKGEGMHLNSDVYIMEVVRDGEQVSPGEEGDVYLTNLENEAMPLVRYRIGDSAVMAERETCGCGSRFPKIKNVLGRKSEGLIGFHGARIPVGSICDVFETSFGLRDFQIIQKSEIRLVARLRPGDNTPENVKRMLAYFSIALGGEPSLEVEEWGKDELPAKYRPVVSEIVVPN